MTINISLQNTTFVILTIIIILTILMSIVIEKEHQRFLNISFDFELLEDLIIFINHTSRRNKFKRFNIFFL